MRQIRRMLLLLTPLLLVACGGGPNSKTDGLVYVPEYQSLALSQVEEGRRLGDAFYFLCAQGEESAYGYESYGLYLLPPEGGGPEELPEYQPQGMPENAEGVLTVKDLRPGGDGTLWITEKLYLQHYDLPEDFDPESGDKWQYYTGSTTAELHRQLDGQGRELRRLDAEKIAGALETERLTALFSDKDGDVIACGDGVFAVLDGEGEGVRFALRDVMLGFGTLPAILSDGRAAVYIRQPEGGGELRTVNKETGQWEESYALPQVTELWAGDREALFYYQSGDGLYRWREGAEAGERVLNWLDARIDAAQVADTSAQADGRLLTLLLSAGRASVAVLTPTAAAAMPERTVLTYAIVGNMRHDLRQAVLSFNRTNPDYYISVEQYGPFATEEEESAAVAHLRAALLAGGGPDILGRGCVENHREASAAGLFEDLWPYIENDPDLGRDALMERVLAAESMGGKLYHLPADFSIITAVGAREVVGDRLGWTAEEMLEALEKMPDGCRIFSEEDSSREIMLQNRLFLDAERFVDWETGTCSFVSEEFREILEFCALFPPQELTWESRFAEIETANRRQMLLDRQMGSFNDLLLCQSIFGDFSFVGYPSGDRRVGSRFFVRIGPSISSACGDKEGAWAFLRTLLLPRFAGSERTVSGYELSKNDVRFPINKADFLWMAEQAMTPVYRTQADGTEVEIPKGSKIYSSGEEKFEVSYYALPQELYDQFMELYESIDQSWDWNQPLYEIVLETAGAYFAGDKTLEETTALIQSRVELYVSERR